MEHGVLADYFEGVGAKRLTGVEVDDSMSNQHEFQGAESFRQFLGDSAGKIKFPTTFYWLDDKEDDEPLSLAAFCTWSNVRRGKPRSPEYHLYYAAEAEPVVYKARAGDLLIIAKTRQDTLLAILCPTGSTIAQELCWLFGLDPNLQDSTARVISPTDSVELGHVARALLDDLMVDIEIPEPSGAVLLVERFGAQFPPTFEFSKFARETFGEVDPVNAPDETLMSWMDHEAMLFRYHERHLVSDHLRSGFMKSGEADVEGFIRFSLSVQNRRKSRAGWALSHHVAAILGIHGLRYTREATTEKRQGPDFLFPGEVEYHDSAFNPELLTMLAVKTSCKDRWRQVLAEAYRISEKHLLTIQHGISEKQTDEMQSESLQLIVPRPIQHAYLPAQRKWLLDFAGFIDLVKARQSR